MLKITLLIFRVIIAEYTILINLSWNSLWKNIFVNCHMHFSECILWWILKKKVHMTALMDDLLLPLGHSVCYWAFVMSSRQMLAPTLCKMQFLSLWFLKSFIKTQKKKKKFRLLSDNKLITSVLINTIFIQRHLCYWSRNYIISVNNTSQYIINEYSISIVINEYF